MSIDDAALVGDHGAIADRFEAYGYRRMPAALTLFNRSIHETPSWQRGQQPLRIGVTGFAEERDAASISPISPRCITAIRSQTWAATLRSCVMNSMADAEAKYELPDEPERIIATEHSSACKRNGIEADQTAPFLAK